MGNIRMSRNDHQLDQGLLESLFDSYKEDAAILVSKEAEVAHEEGGVILSIAMLPTKGITPNKQHSEVEEQEPLNEIR